MNRKKESRDALGYCMTLAPRCITAFTDAPADQTRRPRPSNVPRFDLEQPTPPANDGSATQGDADQC